jgi:hypothetical protein
MDDALVQDDVGLNARAASLEGFPERLGTAFVVVAMNHDWLDAFNDVRAGLDHGGSKGIRRHGRGSSRGEEGEQLRNPQHSEEPRPQRGTALRCAVRL